MQRTGVRHGGARAEQKPVALLALATGQGCRVRDNARTGSVRTFGTIWVGMIAVKACLCPSSCQSSGRPQPTAASRINTVETYASNGLREENFHKCRFESCLSCSSEQAHDSVQGDTTHSA